MLSTHNWNRCIGLCPHLHPLHSISDGQWSPPHCFPLLHLYAPQTQLQCPWQGTARHFQTFKIWHHYLKGSLTPIDVVTDHKNLEYISTPKLLTHCQVHWLEFLSVQPYHLFLPQPPGHQAWCANETMGCLPWRGRKQLCQHKPTQSLPHIHTGAAGIVPLCNIPLHPCPMCHDHHGHWEALLLHPLVTLLQSDHIHPTQLPISTLVHQLQRTSPPWQ